MKVKEIKILIRDLVYGYKNEKGIDTYKKHFIINSKNDICEKQEQRKVIEKIMNRSPVSVVYLIENENEYEIVEGKNVVLSIYDFYNNNVSFDEMYYSNFSKEKKDIFLNYELTTNICMGTETEKIEWFKTANTEGKKMTIQEIRNTFHTGDWLTDAERYFSKRNCPAVSIGGVYVSGRAERQEILEKVLKWKSEQDNVSIEEYMSLHQNDKNAIELWEYYKKVIEWVGDTFPKIRSIMKGVEWGEMYNRFNGIKHNSDMFEERINELLANKKVKNKKGIYEYLLDGKECHLYA